MAAPKPTALSIAVALGAVYLIWGSTYLAIRLVVESMPPLLSAGSRFVVAGAALLLAGRRAGPLSAAHWRGAAVTGGLMLAVGNGGVVWAEQTVDSGVAALILTTVPGLMVLLDWLLLGGRRPTAAVAFGIVAGLGGVALLVQPGPDPVDMVGAGVLLLASVGWAAGSVLAPRMAAPASPVQGAGLQMLCGGVIQLAFGTALGEATAFEPAAVTWSSAAALLYLVVFGSVIAFTAYLWLLRVTSTELVATHAYVNPVVAVALGWAILDEPVTATTVVAAAVILGAVVLIGRARGHRQPALPPAPAPGPSKPSGAS